jgi:hypothetical protein
MVKQSKTEKVPKNMEFIFIEIVEITDQVCSKYLNDEYGKLARSAAAVLCRKRPSPLMTGNINSWACGIIYALGFVNFLFDKSQDPYMNASDLCDKFGVSKSTGSSMSKKVRDLLKMSQLDPNWCLPSKLDKNPMAWMVMINGYIVDIRYMPIEVQEIAYRKGLIPYIPGEKAD